MDFLNTFFEEKRTISIYSSPGAGSTTLLYNLIKKIYLTNSNSTIAFISNDFYSDKLFFDYCIKNNLNIKVDFYKNFDDIKSTYNYIFIEEPDREFNFFNASKKYPKTVLFYTKVTNKNPNTRESYYSSSMMKLIMQSDLAVELTKEENQCFKLKVVKNRGFTSIESFFFSIDSSRNIGIFLEEFEPFFQIKDKRIIKQEKPFLYFNYSTFDDFCAALKIKKYVREFLINKTITETSDGLSFNYNYLNWFYLLKKTYNKFDPHLFVDKMKNINLKVGKSHLLTTNQEDIINTLKFVKQANVYKELPMYSILSDAISMKKTLDKKVSLLSSNRFNSIDKMHDFLIDLDFLVSFESVTFSDSFLIPFDNKTLTVNNNKYTTLVIKNAKQLVSVGRKMNLCIQSSWYVDLVRDNKCNILILSNNDVFEYCLSFDPSLALKEIKSKNNKEVPMTITQEILKGLFDV